MRSALGFFSVLAAGLLIAALVAVIGGGPAAQFPGAVLNGGSALPVSAMQGSRALDIPSLLIGLVLGVGLSFAGRLSWAELPRRLVHWIASNERNFYRAGMAAVMIGILVFY